MLSHDLKRFNLSRCLCAAMLLVFCACAGPVRGLEPGCCREDSDCEDYWACWPDPEHIDDGNNSNDYKYSCNTGQCFHQFRFEYACPDGGCPVTPCKQICSALEEKPRGLEPGCCRKDSDCKFSEANKDACWPDPDKIDDGNNPNAYAYSCNTGTKQCFHQYMWGCPNGGCPVTPCKQICRAPPEQLEGDAVASVPSDTVKSDGKKGGAIRGIVMLIVIIMTSLLIM